MPFLAYRELMRVEGPKHIYTTSDTSNMQIMPGAFIFGLINVLPSIKGFDEG